MKGTWNQSIAAAKQMASAAGDDIAVFVFREEILATATGRAETEKLLDELSTSTPKNGGTALYDTLIEVSARIKTRNAAFVVIGDGEDNASRHSACNSFVHRSVCAVCGDVASIATDFQSGEAER